MEEKHNRGDLIGRLIRNSSVLIDAIAEKEYQNSYLPIVTLKDCIQYFRTESDKLKSPHSAAGFVLSVKKNYDPRNERDSYIVVQGLLDKNNKPIICNGETVSRVLHTKTIDDALIRALDGSESKVFTV